MASVDFTPDAEADVRGLGLSLEDQASLVATILSDLSYLPSRHAPCQTAGPNARRLVTGPYLVVFDVTGRSGAETVSVLMVLPARGKFAAMAVT